MNENNSDYQGATYQAVRIGDIADWHLLVSVSSYGIGAWLRHADPVRPIVTAFCCNWKDGGDELLLDSIENAV